MSRPKILRPDGRAGGLVSAIRWLLLLLLVALSAATLGSQQRSASAVSVITFDGSPGSGAPPATLGPYTMSPFGIDSRTLGVNETNVPDPAGTITFSTPLTHMRVGTSWATWSHGYTGDVYYGGGGSVTLTMPQNTGAFYFYAEPNPFAIFNITATTQDGTTSGPISVDGYAGARYFGFYGSGGATIATIFVSSAIDFAVGEFGISAGCPADAKQYAATGDSIAFGADLTSGSNYPTHLLGDHLTQLASYCLKNLAESGATTTNYRSGGGVFTAQLQPAIDLKASLVTVTIGANNKVLPTLVNECLPKIVGLDFDGARTCANNINNDNNAWTSLSADLKTILNEYQQSLSSNPGLFVAITNYYNPMPPSIDAARQKAFCDQLSPGVAGKCNGMLGPLNGALGAMDSVLHKLNQKIAEAASPYTSSSSHFIFVNVHDEFVGHCTIINLSVSLSPYGGSASGNLGCESSQSWVEPATVQSGGASQKKFGITWTASGTAQAGVHPNDDGHTCISNLVWEAVKGRLGSSEPADSSPCS